MVEEYYPVQNVTRMFTEENGKDLFIRTSFFLMDIVL
jgi:hypothetical protein